MSLHPTRLACRLAHWQDPLVEHLDKELAAPGQRKSHPSISGRGDLDLDFLDLDLDLDFLELGIVVVVVVGAVII